MHNIVGRLRSLFGKGDPSLRHSVDLRPVRSSGLFDETWYLANHPDVANAKVDPLLHYLVHGGFEGRDPGPNFCSAWYLETNPDVKQAGVNPLLHYVQSGREEGRQPNPEAGDLELVRTSVLFDETWYMGKYPDVAEAKVDPLVHYLRNGGSEGRDPGPNFSSAWYLEAYPDVNRARMNPLVHYLRYGRAEGRAISAAQAGQSLKGIEPAHDRPVMTDPAKEEPGLDPYVAFALQIMGWTTEDEMRALARAIASMPPKPIIVEIGSFLGRSAVVLAAAIKLRGGGVLHCVDPFDASGDAIGVPIYLRVQAEAQTSLRQRFDQNISRAEIEEWIRVHQGTAEMVSASWVEPIDVLFLDGDQSPTGARSAYEHWAPFLKAGGILAVHNSSDREYEPGHDGSRRLVLETVRSPQYLDISCVDYTTFARKAGS